MTATRKVTQRKRTTSSDAISVLQHDHRLVDKLFALFDAARDRRERKAAAQRICKVLSVHMAVEEELLYPSAHLALQDDDGVHEAEVEHTTAKVLIADIESLNVTDAKYEATVTVLGEYIRHHVKEEETELFPQLRRTELDLEIIGRRIVARRIELLTDAGIDEADLPVVGPVTGKVPKTVVKRNVAKRNGARPGRAMGRTTQQRNSPASERSSVRDRLQH